MEGIQRLIFSRETSQSTSNQIIYLNCLKISLTYFLKKKKKLSRVTYLYGVALSYTQTYAYI